MWGNIAVGLIALIGVLVPAFWGTRQDVRDRKAMSELAELLAKTPGDLGQRDLLLSHLNDEIAAYVARSKRQHTAKALREAKMLVGIFVAVLVGGLVAYLVWGRDVKFDSIETVSGLSVWVAVCYLLFGLAYFKYTRARRER